MTSALTTVENLSLHRGIFLRLDLYIVNLVMVKIVDEVAYDRKG